MGDIALKRTANYSLPTWEKSDFIQMSDFNDLTQKLDAALKSHGDTLSAAGESVAALTTDLGSGGQNCRAVVGSYVGTGTYGEANKLTLQAPFTPLLVMVANPAESSSIVDRVPLWMRGMAKGSNGYSGNVVVLQWGEHSVSWYTTNTSVNGPEHLQQNVSGLTYNYVILGV